MTDTKSKRNKKIEEIKRILWWSLHITTFILFIVIIYRFVPSLMIMLNLFLDIATIKEKSPELQMLFFFAGIYIWCKLISVICNILDKINGCIDRWLK